MAASFRSRVMAIEEMLSPEKWSMDNPVANYSRLWRSFSFARPKENEPKVPLYGMP
jgi:hypothetical protein